MEQINVGGRIYVLPVEVINQLSNLDKHFTARSPILFDHVISFVLDPTYPFPAEYKNELDYYGVTYEVSKLYNQYEHIKKSVDTIIEGLNTINSNIIIVNKNALAQQVLTKKKLNRIEDSVDDTCCIQ